ncbi:MAG: DUF2892 domain-containing protein, partial [Rhodocyclaceae bacterium]|nr:DUF2892 domain-containing protein [Rhodocyclaceae bacterium]
MSQLSWLWFTAFVGANLFQSGFTKFCPLETILIKLGVVLLRILIGVWID